MVHAFDSKLYHLNVFVCLDREEFLFLLNLKKSQIGETRNDQSWLNDVYKFEKFDIGEQFNVLLGVNKVCFVGRNFSNIKHSISR